jgi:hypothetical protein
METMFSHYVRIMGHASMAPLEQMLANATVSEAGQSTAAPPHQGEILQTLLDKMREDDGLLQPLETDVVAILRLSELPS